tara:strand:+ start:1607 stop:2140 length:534 start_codon:yes stop_codon:yes gene_type:complete
LRLIHFIIYFIFNFISTIIVAQTIAVVNIQSLIDNNTKYKSIINEINESQKIYLDNFEKKENELTALLREIEDSKLILNENEINLKISNYNNQLNDFTKLIENFNSHYQNVIMIIRENILKEIIILLENYAIDNNVNLVLDSTSYLIASNSLDITNTINEQLSQIDLKLEYKNFEKN